MGNTATKWEPVLAKDFDYNTYMATRVTDYQGVPPYYTLDGLCRTVYLPGWEYYNTKYVDKYRVRYLHGWLAVFAWSFLGSIMIVANRYLSGVLWRQFFWIHAIAGILLYLINFATCFYVWQNTSFGVAWKYSHPYICVPLFLFTIFVVYQGILVKFRQANAKWDTREAIKQRKMHMFTGYLFMIGGQAGILTGFNFCMDVVSTIWFGGIILLFEIWYQFDRRREIQFKSPPTKVSHHQFMEMVEAGHHVAVLDDLVVDLAKYHFHHPGGAFVLKQNIGRDLSKYFHGAFSMENIGGGRVFNWYHSTNARRIVNSLAIARYIKRAPVRIVNCILERNTNSTGTCKTFRFKSIYQSMDNGPEEHLIKEENDGTYLCPLIDHTSVARHYLIKSTSHPDTIGGPSPEGIFDDRKHGIRRQFTECFSMRKDVYEALCKIGTDPHDCQDAITILKQSIAQFNQTGTCLSIKSYEGNTGLSKFIFDHVGTSRHIYEIKGPMGSGLACCQTGKHVAYTAGTGILVFLDLVAYLVIRIVDRHYNLGVGSASNNNIKFPVTGTIGGDNSRDSSMKSPLNNSRKVAGREGSMTGNSFRGVGVQGDSRSFSQTQGSSMYNSEMTGFAKHKRIHGSPDPLDLDNFTFEMHTSFASEEEAMGLELVDVLVDLCDKFNYRNLFIHYCRISKVKKGEKVRQPVGKRMDEAAYREELLKMEASGLVEKVYVCGPPVMQEHFDRAQDAIPNKRIEYHVL